MKRKYTFLCAIVAALLCALILAGCGEELPLLTEPPLTAPPSAESDPYAETIQHTYPEGNLTERPGCVYGVAWERWLQVSFSDGSVSTYYEPWSSMPVFLYSEEELEAAMDVLKEYLEKEYMTSDGSYRYQKIVSIAIDPFASSEFLEPEARYANKVYKEEWSNENYYAHYIDFDVVLSSEDAANYGEADEQVFHVSLYRDDALNQSPWRIRQCTRDWKVSAPYEESRYRPLSAEELELFGDLGGKIVFGAEMLHYARILNQMNRPCWVYVYMEETDEIVRHEIAGVLPFEIHIPEKGNS